MTIRGYPQGSTQGAINAAAGTPKVINLTTIAGGASQNGYVAETDYLMVTTADGTNKVITLPDPNKYGGTPGDDFVIVNSASGQTLSVYPPTGGNISGAGANTAASISNNITSCFCLISFTASASVWTSQVGA
jgi:hypothetical protein